MAENPRILVNQVGYDLGKEKSFLVQLEKRGQETEFQVIDLGGELYLTGTARDVGEVDKWGQWYLRGDFTPLQREGKFMVTMEIEGQTLNSFPFQISEDLLLNETGRPASDFFRYQRCGCRVEGWHGSCHLDDGKMGNGSHIDVSGGWHDAGDYNKYNGFTPLSVLALTWSYQMKPGYFGKWRANEGIPTIIEEALWGAQWLMKMQPEPGKLMDRVFSGYSFWGRPENETDNICENEDDRPIEGEAGACPVALAAASLSKLSSWRPDDGYLQAARNLWMRNRERERFLQSEAAMIICDLALKASGSGDVYMEDMEKRIAFILDSQQSEGWFSTGQGEPFNSITQMGLPAAALAQSALETEIMKADIEKGLSRYWNFSLKMASNPFRISTLYHGDGSTSFFHRYPDQESWYVGQNSQYLSQAWAALLAHRLTGNSRYRRYALSQINWVLGMNPFGLCMMEGEGRANPGVYHHRYDTIPGRNRGAVPGCIPNGIVRLSPEEDIPRFDLGVSGREDYHSNEPWLPHNAFYLLAVSHL